MARREAVAECVRGNPGVEEIQGLIDRLEAMRRRLWLQRHRLAALLESAAQAEPRRRGASHLDL